MAHDTLADYLRGTLRNANEPSTIYLASLKGYPDIYKLGFCQIRSRALRCGDPLISSMVFDYSVMMCEEDAVMMGDMPRSEAYLIEQYLLWYLTSHREVIPELAKKKWPGYTETLRFSPKGIQSFLKWLPNEISHLRCLGTTTEGEMLDQLVSTAEERALYGELKKEWEMYRIRMRRKFKKREAC